MTSFHAQLVFGHALAISALLYAALQIVRDRPNPRGVGLAAIAFALEVPAIARWPLLFVVVLTMYMATQRFDENTQLRSQSLGLIVLLSNAVFVGAQDGAFDADLQNLIIAVALSFSLTSVPQWLAHRLVAYPLGMLLFVAAALGLSVPVIARALPASSGLHSLTRPGPFVAILLVAATAALFDGVRSDRISGRHGRIGRHRVPALRDLLPVSAAALAMFIVFATTNDLGNVLLVVVGVASTIAASIRERWAAIAVVCGGLFGVGASGVLGLADERWEMLLRPWDQAPDQAQSHLARSLTAAVDGGLWGSGLTAPSFGFVPEIARDGAGVAVLSTLGIAGFAALVVALTSWSLTWWRAVDGRLSGRAASFSAGLMAIGIASSVLSIGGSVGLLPWTGLPIPAFARSGLWSFVLVALHPGSGRRQDNAEPKSIRPAPQKIGIVAVCLVALVFGKLTYVDLTRPGNVFAQDQYAATVRFPVRERLLDSTGSRTDIPNTETIQVLEELVSPSVQSFAGLVHVRPGGDVLTTIDPVFQNWLDDADSALGASQFGAVALDFGSGNIVAAFGRRADPFATELAPGSIHKLVVAAAILEGASSAGQTFDELAGGLRIDGFELPGPSCGDNLHDALAASCNAVFAEYGRTNEESLRAMSMRFGFTPEHQFGAQSRVSQSGEMPNNASIGVHPDASDRGEVDRALMGIGQSDVLTTPLGAALVAATFFNEGVMPTPGFVEARRVGTQVVSVDTAKYIADAMRSVWAVGTAAGLADPALGFAGKTGTASADNGPNRAWCTLVLEGDGVVVSAVAVGDLSGRDICRLLVDTLPAGREG